MRGAVPAQSAAAPDLLAGAPVPQEIASRADVHRQEEAAALVAARSDARQQRAALDRREVFDHAD